MRSSREEEERLRRGTGMSDNGKINAGGFVRHENRDAVPKAAIAKDGRVAIGTPVMTAGPCLIEDADRTDNKDAFLFGMQALPGKHDACICDGGLYCLSIGIDRHGHTSRRIGFPAYMMGNNASDAENIMYDGIN